MRVYCDANATYGVLPEVRDSLTSFLSQNLAPINPSAVHLEGQEARALLDGARQELFKAFGLSPSSHRIVFTSGATEGNNSLLLSSLLGKSKERSNFQVVSSTVEHPSVEEGLKRLERLGVEVLRVQPSSEGVLSAEAILGTITKKTTLLTLVWANNESGVIHPIDEIFTVVRQRFPTCLLHTDGVQYLAKNPLSVNFPFDALTLSPHKFGALPGIGITVLNAMAEVTPLLVGGAQELSLRAGTENLLGVLSVQSALPGHTLRAERYETVIRLLRDEFEGWVTAHFPEVRIIGSSAPRLANTSLLWIQGLSTADLVAALDIHGVACSRGSACSSGKQLTSHTMLGLGYSEQAAGEVLRLSFRADFSQEELCFLKEQFALCFSRFRR